MRSLFKVESVFLENNSTTLLLSRFVPFTGISVVMRAPPSLQLMKIIAALVYGFKRYAYLYIMAYYVVTNIRYKLKYSPF